MAIDRDLFLAILAMDSYNRGYDQGVGGRPFPTVMPMRPQPLRSA